uniref:DoxX family protein n=1 Tax=Anisakis simplex TaxID=6269 RepID=A0A0M3JJR8_ANISI
LMFGMALLAMCFNLAQEEISSMVSYEPFKENFFFPAV